ncbi:hypothetical protein [Streptococcus ruminantium]|uniref:hypothetical protein n=1 Tax=Streptococcus ruminantium TaxID=1917441 RepID=UPI001F3E7483|nr:hypothetical protein [Streptococcus ruminantium]BDD42625.1 hypothetical protein GUT189_09580 [Streptococcus ruminantium]
MRTWSVVGKYPVYTDGKISHTEITIASTTGGYATYTERVLGDQMAKTDAELVGLAKEAHFKIEYADRAMAESVQKIEELDQIAKKAKAFMSTVNQEFEAIKSRQEAAEAERETRFKAIEAKFQILNGSVMEILTELYSKAEEVTEDESLKDDVNVDGSDSSTDNENTETE